LSFPPASASAPHQDGCHSTGSQRDRQESGS
jgi:hypothetical protein